MVNRTAMKAWPEYTCNSSMEEGDGSQQDFSFSPEKSPNEACRIQQKVHILCP
ncbi:hypothetical protein AMTRI_Chr13g83680 [Amborella trichopoda]